MTRTSLVASRWCPRAKYVLGREELTLDVDAEVVVEHRFIDGVCRRSLW
jgi:hypothetical protein